MEERILFGPESARQWSAAESTLEASTDRIRMQRPTLRWHITVNHLAGEARYPIGWPRVSGAPCGEAATRDWSGWDFLQLWVYTDTTRAGLPQEPVGLALHTPDKEGAYNRPLAGLKKGEWVRVLVPLTEVPRHHDVRLMQLHVSGNPTTGTWINWISTSITSPCSAMPSRRCSVLQRRMRCCLRMRRRFPCGSIWPASSRASAWKWSASCARAGKPLSTRGDSGARAAASGA